MNNRKGFTLIELLVVVLIIGILASIALPQYFKTVEKSRASEALTMISTLSGAQDREFMRSGTYTSDVVNLDVEVNNMKFFELGKMDVTATECTISIKRKANPTPPATYGEYTIDYKKPIPGTGVGQWSCTPAPACNTFLPG
ncbi:MAG TPA: hypothetical protein DCL44_02170 [Elusimicrobia bacterium]|nr:hypothetical protein [Elusimicrobiota bacterium]